MIELLVMCLIMAGLIVLFYFSDKRLDEMERQLEVKSDD